MINIPDLINGTFELTGGVVCWLNVRSLLKDKKIEGVDWRVSGFFSAWGVWNLFYYPSLSQWAIFAGGLLLVIANTTWVVLALRIIKWNQHMQHKAYEPNCSLCRRALDWLPDSIKNLPEIKHTYKCECDLCSDRGHGGVRL